MNTLRATIQASIADPDLLWHFWIDSSAGVWRAALIRGSQDPVKYGWPVEAGPIDFAGVAEIIHAPHIPRTVRYQLADLLRAAGLLQDQARTL